MISDESLKAIKEAIKLDKVGRFEVYAYLAEEVGEVATAMATEAGLKNKTLKESSRSECVDVVVSAIALFYKLGGTEKEFGEVCEFKSQRWLKRAIKRAGK